MKEKLMPLNKILLEIKLNRLLTLIYFYTLEIPPPFHYLTVLRQGFHKYSYRSLGHPFFPPMVLFNQGVIVIS